MLRRYAFLAIGLMVSPAFSSAQEAANAPSYAKIEVSGRLLVKGNSKKNRDLDNLFEPVTPGGGHLPHPADEFDTGVSLDAESLGEVRIYLGGDKKLGDLAKKLSNQAVFLSGELREVRFEVDNLPRSRWTPWQKPTKTILMIRAHGIHPGTDAKVSNANAKIELQGELWKTLGELEKKSPILDTIFAQQGRVSNDVAAQLVRERTTTVDSSLVIGTRTSGVIQVYVGGEKEMAQAAKELDRRTVTLRGEMRNLNSDPAFYPPPWAFPGFASERATPPYSDPWQPAPLLVIRARSIKAVDSR